MDNDLFDDGLVHSHHWATEKPVRPAQPAAVTGRGEHDHDDGLVHGHDWASGEK